MLHSDDEHDGACSITQLPHMLRNMCRSADTAALCTSWRLSHFTSSVDFTSSAAVCHDCAAARPVRLSAEQQRATAAALHIALPCELTCASAVHVLLQLDDMIVQLCVSMTHESTSMPMPAYAYVHVYVESSSCTGERGYLELTDFSFLGIPFSFVDRLCRGPVPVNNYLYYQDLSG